MKTHGWDRWTDMDGNHNALITGIYENMQKKN